MRVYPSGGDVTSACDATTPPAPGRFSTTTDWPHCRETTSPSVRARISTPPPAEYGTKICTVLDGNGDCADAIPPATDSAIAAATIWNHLFKASLPIFRFSFISYISFIARLIARPHAGDIALWRRSRVRSGHVDNPADRVKFRRLERTVAINLRAKILARRKGEFDGGCRGTKIVPDPA